MLVITKKYEANYALHTIFMGKIEISFFYRNGLSYLLNAKYSL
jgi:hypothetical protein